MAPGTRIEHRYATALARGDFGAGAMSAGAYWIAVWAMTQAPIAVVAALRESSVLFATLISVAVLREGFAFWRTLGAVLIVSGIAAITLR